MNDDVSITGGDVPCRFFLAPALSPHWYVTKTSNASEANMAYFDVIAQVILGGDLIKADRHITRSFQLANEEDLSSVGVRIPVLINTKALCHGDVLLCHGAQEAKVLKRAGAITTAQVAKKTCSAVR